MNSPITITDQGDQTFNEGDAVSVPITATDSDTNAGNLTFTANGLPSGLIINNSNGMISGNISASNGNYTSTITVSDGNNTDEDTFNWTIYPASNVTVLNPGTQNSTEGTSIGTLSIGGNNTLYSGNGTLLFAATDLPPGLVMDPTTGNITGIPSAGDATFSPYITTVTVTDGTNSDSQWFSWNVNSPSALSSALTNPDTK